MLTRERKVYIDIVCCGIPRISHCDSGNCVCYDYNFSSYPCLAHSESRSGHFKLLVNVLPSTNEMFFTRILFKLTFFARYSIVINRFTTPPQIGQPIEYIRLFLMRSLTKILEHICGHTNSDVSRMQNKRIFEKVWCTMHVFYAQSMQFDRNTF